MLRSRFECLFSKTLLRGVEGDLVETGVWRGGASMMHYAAVQATDSKKHVWLFDSFRGLPASNNKARGDY